MRKLYKKIKIQIPACIWRWLSLETSKKKLILESSSLAKILHKPTICQSKCTYGKKFTCIGNIVQAPNWSSAIALENHVIKFIYISTIMNSSYLMERRIFFLQIIKWHFFSTLSWNLSLANNIFSLLRLWCPCFIRQINCRRIKISSIVKVSNIFQLRN